MTLHARLLSAVAITVLAIARPAHPAFIRSQPRIPQAAVIGEPVDINTASIDQLMRIPGLTRTWAARIIRYRPYRGKNELLDHGVVNAAVYSRIKDRIIAHRQGR